MSEWSELIAKAERLGYTVELVEWVECGDCPGLLGMAEGAILYNRGRIRIRESLLEADRCRVLRHELMHAENPEADIEEGPVWEMSSTGRRRRQREADR